MFRIITKLGFVDGFKSRHHAETVAKLNNWNTALIVEVWPDCPECDENVDYSATPHEEHNYA